MLGLSSGLIHSKYLTGVPSGIGVKYMGEWQGSAFDSAFMDAGKCLDLGTNDFTISCWIKNDELSVPTFALTNPPFEGSNFTDFHFLTKDGNVSHGTASSDNVFIHCYISNRRLKVIMKNGSSFLINSKISEVVLGPGGFVQTFNHDPIPANTWVHFCITADRSANAVIYLNGSPLDNFSTYDISGLQSINLDSVGHWRSNIVGSSGTTRYYGGNIDELGIWNSALSANNVAAVYNNGKQKDLLTNSGNYDQASALQGYFRFGDGVGDIKVPETATVSQGASEGSPQDDAEYYRIIRNQVDTGFSSELWDATQPSVSSWTAFGNNTISVNDGAVRITYVDNEFGAKALLNNATNLTTDISTGAYISSGERHWYKITCKVKVNSGSSLHVKHAASDYGALVIDGVSHTGLENYHERTVLPVTSTNYTDITMYVEGRSATQQYIAFEGMSSGEIVWIKDISVKKLNGDVATFQFDSITPNTGSNNSAGQVLFVDGPELPIE
jgi:hypothetical protein